MADPESSPELYDEAVDTFATLLDYNLRTKLEGEEKGGDLGQGVQAIHRNHLR